MAEGTSRSAIKMMEHDRASESLGMIVEVCEPGHSVVSMRVRDDMLNGFGITHGGFVFAVADTAFAIACNDGDAATVAAGADVTFLATTRSGDTLTARAVQRSVAGRSGLYDVQVTDQNDRVVAEFRGRSRRTNLPMPSTPAA